MATDPDVPAEADSEQLDRSAAAINDAKAAAGHAVRNETIDPVDMPTAGENVPGVRPPEAADQAEDSEAADEPEGSAAEEN
jgi:hypothetical protein